MCRKKKYVLDKADLQFKQSNMSVKDKALNALMWFVLSAGLSIIYIIVFKSLFGNPKESMLSQRLENIKLSYSLVAKRLDNSMARLEDFQLSDDMRYRPMLGMDLLPETYRKAGFGGIDRYRSLAGYMNSDMMVHYNVKMDVASNMAKFQRESFKSVGERAAEWKMAMDHQPFISPIDPKYRISDGFRLRDVHPVLGTQRWHNGLDIAAPYGTEVYVTGNGAVVDAGWNSGLGNYIIVDHSYGLRTAYGHLSKMHVAKGALVKRGDVIGLVGNTGISSGPHLHYEIIHYGQNKNPINFFNDDMTTEEYNEMIQTFASRYKFR